MSLSSTTPAATSTKCTHGRIYHHDSVCMGKLECQCSTFVEPILFELGQRVEEEKHIRKSIYKRVQYILEKIPQTRNAGEKTFAKIYWELWEGFKIRKGDPQVLDLDTWKRLTPADTINREKRRVKHDHPELAT